MNYQEAKNKKFREYCGDGKIKLVKKWIDNPNVNINWNSHHPLRIAVKKNQLEVVKLLLDNPKLETDYENDRRPLTGSMGVGNFNMEMNPFTYAMADKRWEILDLFVKSGKFTIKRKENLDVLLGMEDEEMNTYFRELDGFTDYIIEQGGDYLNIFPEDAREIFLF